jgi:hypothetical protein
MGFSLLENRVCVDLFIAPTNNENIDIVTFAPLVQITGGDLYLFPLFS